MVTRVVTSLTGHHTGETSAGISLTVLKLPNQTTEYQQRKVMTQVLAKLPIKQLGKNFLVIVSFSYVNSIMEVAKNLGLVTPYSQWLYVISDTNENRKDISTLGNMIAEGDNVAFLYNVTAKSSRCTVKYCNLFYKYELRYSICSVTKCLNHFNIFFLCNIYEHETQIVIKQL